jgi:uncharacterized cupredoxin-like copper-binding protein
MSRSKRAGATPLAAALALGFLVAGGVAAGDPRVRALTVSLKTTGHSIVFDQTSLEAPFGTRLRLTYKNAAGKGSMINHDVAIIKPGRDQQILEILQQNDYKLDSIKGSKDVIGLTKTLQPGESDTIEFLPPERGDYVYICLMPGHGDIMGMRGTLRIK